MMGWRNDAVATVRRNTKMRRFTFLCIYVFVAVAAYHTLYHFSRLTTIFVPPTRIFGVDVRRRAGDRMHLLRQKWAVG